MLRPQLVALLALLLLVAHVRPAHATNYFACDCASGAASACTAGDDLNAGTSPANPWRSYARARQAWGTLAAGDTIAFCRGGAFAIAGSTQWVNGACRASNPCVLQSYGAPWGSGTEARPRLLQTAGDGISFAEGGAPEHEEGYVIRDLELVCSNCTNAHNGVLFYNDIDAVRLERLSIRGFGIGVYQGGSAACAGAPGCDALNTQISLLASEILDSHFHGFLGGGNDLVIADNVFSDNGTSGFLEHNIYISGFLSNVSILRNRLYHAAAAATGRCQSASFVAHGRLTDLLIEGNLIYEDLGGAEGGCWGINVSAGNNFDEIFERAVIRGNTIHNVGQTAIAVSNCVDCLVENNLIVQEQVVATVGISAPASASNPGDALMQALTVRNNSIYIGASNSTGIRINNEGSGHRILSNAIQSTTTSGYWHCLALNLPAAAYSAINHNVCGYVPANQHEWELNSGTLAQWQLVTGFDLASISGAPGFAAPATPFFDLSASSAVATMVGMGHPTASAPLDVYARPRGASPDAGAHQFGSTAAVFADGFE